ncbi:MAG: hypothetical protein ABIQ09_00845 [Jatrophihabitantaceae bacterium]
MNGMVRLRYLAEVNPSTPEFDKVADDQAVTFMPLETVWADNRLDTSRSRPKAEVASGYVRFTEGDILCPKVTPTFQAGRSALIDSLPARVGAASTEVHVVRPRPGLADSRFIRYGLLTQPFLEGGVSRFQGVAGLQRVPDEFLKDVRLRAFGLVDQRRIADYLDDQVARIDNIISARREQIALIGEADRSIRARTLGGDSPTAMHQLLGPIDPSWPVRRLAEVVNRIGVGVVVNPSSYFTESGVPFLHGGNIREGYIELNNVKHLSVRNSDLLWRSRLDAGDVVVVRAGYPGRAAVVPAELDGANCASILLIKPSKLAIASWIELFFNSPQGRAQVALAQYGAAQEQINVGDVVNFLIPVPSVQVQQAHLNRQRESTLKVRQLMAAAEKQLVRFHEVKRSLITAAVTGGFDVSTADGSRVPV